MTSVSTRSNALREAQVLTDVVDLDKLGQLEGQMQQIMAEIATLEVS